MSSGFGPFVIIPDANTLSFNHIMNENKEWSH